MRQHAKLSQSTALLLARLEQENNALVTNPKSGLAKESHPQSQRRTRPPSIQHLKKLVNEPARPALRYSQLPTPPMTELEFWAALVSDYPQTAQRLPTLTSNKIRGGVPPPLRGVVWPSIAGARDTLLHFEFQRLCCETSPYEGLIGKDVGRSFPNVEMFRDPQGEGQLMLGRVLKAFSLYDHQIGYCQGLGFVVGPLLMHMSDSEAFCVLVRFASQSRFLGIKMLTIIRLMEHYNLRSCYLPDLSGLHLRIFQFQNLLTRHLPELSSHLEQLKVEPLYVSQWFLSFFAVTCPLPMLLRIYDVILAEGATETLMRVALSLMKRNQKKLMACSEFEDAMQLLLSRSLWDTYAYNADDLVADFVSLTGLVTRESLQTLEGSFTESQNSTKLPSLKATASQLLGRFWAGSSHSSSKSSNNLSVTVPSRPTSFIRRTPSKQSMASTLSSFESGSDASTLATEASVVISRKSEALSIDTAMQVEKSAQTKDKDLHSQIEDLLTAMSDMHRQQTEMGRELQKEREEREEDREVARNVLHCLKSQLSPSVRHSTVTFDAKSDREQEIRSIVTRGEEHFEVKASKRTSILQTKHQLRDAAVEWKEKHAEESSRCQDLMRQLDEREKEHAMLKEQIRDARSRVQDGHRDKQRLEKTVHDLRTRKPPPPESPTETGYSPISESGDARTSTGLREFKLGRSDTAKTVTFSKRTSSLNMQTVLATENHQPVEQDALLLELVNAKTAEAVARQELEEMKGKLDSLKKLFGGSTASPGHRVSPIEFAGLPLGTGSAQAILKTAGESPKATPTGTGGFFSGWGKRSASTTAA